jgi:MerR family transcriptional regulator, thiopeptide resistance regulator
MAAGRARYSVSEVARLAGVTVRTLRHYDQIGLLSPGERSDAGYRRYGEDDLRRLQRILFYRELGFGLGEIASLVDESDVETADHLRRQHELLTARLERTRRLIEAVETAMEAENLGISLSPQERFEVFGDIDLAEHGREAAEHWGQTDAYQQSRRRTQSYSKQDWLAIKAEGEEITAAFAAAQAAGEPADSAAAMAAAERHRQHITRWFFDCTPDAHQGLGEMYVTDERFAANYEPIAPGLAAYIRDAITANSARLGLE